MNVVIFTEANVVLSSVAKVNLPNFTCTNHCCRTQENIKGGGGGGVLIFIHHALPCLPGYDRVCGEKHEMEHCSTTIYPQYDFGLPLNIVGVYRPPEYHHPSYEEALKKMLADFESKQVTTIIAGDINVTSRKKEYEE